MVNECEVAFMRTSALILAMESKDASPLTQCRWSGGSCQMLQSLQVQYVPLEEFSAQIFNLSKYIY